MHHGGGSAYSIHLQGMWVAFVLSASLIAYFVARVAAALRQRDADLAAAQARGIAVGYTPDVLNDCVADLAMALMLDVGRRISEADRFVRRGDWTTPGAKSFPLARKVSGAKLGIVGLGRIGQTIARRASGFEMDIRYHSRRPVAGVAWAHEPSLIELARWCDYLVVITAGGAATRHLVNDAVLDALGPRGFVINVARGSVIDEAALVRALVDPRARAMDGMPAFATPVTYRDGNTQALWADRTTPVGGVPLFYLFADAFNAMDPLLDANPTKRESWQAARSALVDQLLTVDGSGSNCANGRVLNAGANCSPWNVTSMPSIWPNAL